MTKISLSELENIFSKWAFPISKVVFIDAECCYVGELKIKLRSNYDWSSPGVDFDLDETMIAISKSINPQWFTPSSLEEIMMLAACKNLLKVDNYVVIKG
jgi:hypothetical protein